MPTRLESLKRQQAQIKAQVQQAEARERTKEEKRDTRRKFLVGEAILCEVKSGRFRQADLTSIMSQFLISENDRALFGLESQSDDDAVDNRTGHVITGIEFEKIPSTAVVNELLPTIEHYRSEGRTLSEIYTALHRKNLLSIDSSSQMTWPVFKNVYYQQRKEASTDSQLEQSKHNGVEKETESAETKQIGKTRAGSAVKKKRRRSIVKGSKAG